MRNVTHVVTALACILAGAAGVALPASSGLPAKYERSQVVVRLERGQGCMGCAVYSVTVRADGTVAYEGRSGVLVKGSLGWVIPQTDADALIDAVRKARYFGLSEQYGEGMYDGTNDRSTITNGGKTRTVADRGGSTCDPRAPAPRCVPAPLRDLHDAIDRLSQSIAVTRIDDGTTALLERAGFDFTSPAAASALLFSLNERNTRLARELIAHGAPLAGGALDDAFGGVERVPAIIGVPMTGDLELAQAMIARGALADAETRANFLLSSAGSGGAAMTKLALERFGDLRAQPVPFPLVVAAAMARKNTEGSYYRELNAKPEYATWVRNFDPPAVMRLLIAAGADARAVDRDGNTALHVTDNADVAQILVDAGADPNAVNAKGRTPLHEADSASLARVLIRAGAHVDAEDVEGETPLFERYDARAVEALLDAGADIGHRSHDGRTALFGQSNPETTEVLIRHGADVKVRSPDGDVPLSFAKSIGSALVLLRAGASLPEDPAKLRRLMQWAEGNESAELLQALRERMERNQP